MTFDSGGLTGAVTSGFVGSGFTGAGGVTVAVFSAVAGLAAFAGGQDGTHGRAMRIDRLRDERWQLCYLAAFAHLVETRLPLGGLDTADKVVFLAAAYNRGFWLPREEIERSKTWRLFPARLPVFGQGPFGYADVAVDFYERYWREMILTSLRT